VRGRAAVVDPTLLKHNDGTPSPIQAPPATFALVSTSVGSPVCRQPPPLRVLRTDCRPYPSAGHRHKVEALLEVLIHAGVRLPDPRDEAPVLRRVPIRADSPRRRSGPGGARACSHRPSNIVDAQLQSCLSEGPKTPDSIDCLAPGEGRQRWNSQIWRAS
jgi:hypothetical protein